MLQIEKVDWGTFNPDEFDGVMLYRVNPDIFVAVRAPVFWFVDCGCDYVFFKLAGNDFCTDDMDARKRIESMPMGTYATATLRLTYKEVVAMCENYLMGEYRDMVTEREWKDFCETLLDIKGIRDLTEDE